MLVNEQILCNRLRNFRRNYCSSFKSKKHSVDLFDKARGPGGRSSFKRLDKVKGFDHGTQYISPKSPAFKKFINNLIKKKILKNWSGNHLFLNKVKKENKNHLKIIGRKGNNDISKYLLKNIKCYFQTELKKIDYNEKKWVLTFSDGNKKIYEKLILTCPFAQLTKLSKKFIKAPFIKMKVKMDANITVMFVIKKTNKNVSSYLFDDKFWVGLQKKIVKKDLKVIKIYGLCKVLIIGQIRRLTKIEKIKI